MTIQRKKPITETRKRKMQVLHQVIYFNVHNGTRRTPLHLMNAQSIHEIKYQIKSNNFYLTSARVKTIKHKPWMAFEPTQKCKSWKLITTLNHYGLCISYNNLQRYHNDTAGLILESSHGQVLLSKSVWQTGVHDCCFWQLWPRGVYKFVWYSGQSWYYFCVVSRETTWCP